MARSTTQAPEVTFVDLSEAEAKALRLLERKRGVDVPTICAKMELEERQARSLIDRLRRKGIEVERTGKGVFHAEHVSAKKQPSRAH